MFILIKIFAQGCKTGGERGEGALKQTIPQNLFKNHKKIKKTLFGRPPNG